MFFCIKRGGEGERRGMAKTFPRGEGCSGFAHEKMAERVELETSVEGK